MAMGSGMLAKPISDVAGLSRLGLEGLRRAGIPGIEERDPLTVKQDVQRELTYEPRTTAGRAVTQYNPLALIGRLISAIGQKGGGAVERGIGGPLGSALGSGTREAIEQAPLFVGGGMAKATTGAAKLARGGAERLMHSALKPSAKFAKGADEGINTMLEKGINVTPGGLDKLRAMVDDKNSQISQLIASSPARVDKGRVAARLHDALTKFEKQVDPHSDLATIQKKWDDFMNHPLLTGKDIPVSTAQAMKTGTYRQLREKYGQQGSAEVEAEKALARGLKEEISKAVPQVRQLNAEESKLLTALPMLERRVLVSAGKNPFGLGVLSMNPKNLAVWMADRSELFKSLIARMLNTGSGALNAVAPFGPFMGAAMTPQARGQISPPPIPR